MNNIFCENEIGGIKDLVNHSNEQFPCDNKYAKVFKKPRTRWRCHKFDSYKCKF